MNIALVGLGGMGTVHYMNYRQIAGASVVAAVGQSDSDKARAAQWQLPLYATLGELAANHAVDVVDICVPTFLHKAFVLESLALKVHTIVEKPIALSLVDAEEMYRAADENGVQLYVAQVLQFAKEVEVLRRVTESGLYGRAIDASFLRLSAKPAWSQGSWLFDKEKSGLLPFDLHIHDLDVIVSLFGVPKKVAYTSCAGPDSPFSEQYRFTYTYENLSVNAEAAWLNANIPFTATWRVTYENGALWYDGERVIGYPKEGEPHVFDTAERIKVETGINLAASGWFYEELSHLLACAKDNSPSPRVTRERALSVIRILEGIHS